jgi:hypothetical protein
MALRTVLLGFAVGLCLFSAAAAQSDHYVNGYYRSDGTYVSPHYQTNPNSTRDDNYSTRGNVNPYTGQPGTKPRDEDFGAPARSYQPAYGAPAYGSPYSSSYGNPGYGQGSAGSSYDDSGR